MNKTLSRGLMACLSLVALASCQDYDGGFSLDTIKKAEYAKHFEDTFGKIDPNQDWSMATLVKANVNLPGLTGTAKMNICTGDPRNSETRLLAQIMLKDGQGSIDFDAIKGSENVFVTVEQDGEYKVFGQYALQNGMLNIGNVELLPSFMATRSFSATDLCPTVVGETYSNLFTNIPSTVSKYHFGDKYYTLKELQAWGEEHKSDMTLSSHAPFNNDCVISGTYDFSSASINISKVSTISESGYLYNGQFFTEAQLRSWANAEAAAGQVNSSNYTTATPFADASVIPAGYNFTNAQIDYDVVTVADKDGYWFNNSIYTKQDLIEYALEKYPQGNAQYNGIDNAFSSGVSWTGTTYDLTSAVPQVPIVSAGSTYIYGNYAYSLQGLQDLTTGQNKFNSGPFKNCYFDHESLDFSSATIDNSKVTTVAAGSYIYDGQVFASESALQTYTVDNNLDNFGPYENCCQGSHLDFTNASIDETQAPLEAEMLHIDLTYLSNVQHDAADPWTCGEGYSLFGDYGFFEEQQYYYGQNGKERDKTLAYGSTAEERKEVIRKIESGFKITTTGGAINLPFIYGATGKYDQLGYVFYKDGEDPLAQPHYVVIENAMPKENLHKGSATGETFSDTNMYYQFMKGLASAKTYSTESDAKMQEYIDYYNTKVYGTNYPVVYIDPKTGNGTYDIPSGLNMVFFIVSVGKESDLTNHSGYETGNFNYSIPELNKRIGHPYANTASPTYDEMKENGFVKATAWKSGDKVFLGFEDGGSDEDLNDIVFLVSGHFDTEDIVTLQPIKWHINKNKSHDTTDSDLFEIYNLKPGDSYSNPANEPVNGSLTFLGWSTTPDNSSNDLTKTITNATVPSNGKCYFAIWDDPTPADKVKITWHKNWNSSADHNDTDASNIHFQESVVKTTGTYSKPSTDPAAPTGKVFVGWALSATAGEDEVIDPSSLVNLISDTNKCYYAVYKDAPTPGPDPDWISWTIACEDLGGTFDYDFNDLVFALKKTPLEDGTNAKLELIPLAAGGTLEAHILYNGADKGEIHTMLGGGTNYTQIINATAGQTAVAGNPVLLEESISASTSINDLSGKISIRVVKTGETTASYIVANGDKNGIITPQMMLLPDGWKWPSEGIKISTVYEGFADWVKNSYKATWVPKQGASIINNPMNTGEVVIRPNN